VKNRLCGLACDSNASGNACKRDVANMMPTDRLTMRSTIFDNRPKEKIAAIVMLKAPDSAVASRI